MTFSPDFLNSEAKRLGHRLGWLFLTCPERLIETASVALITTNPGGEEANLNFPDGGEWSVEAGNASLSGHCSCLGVDPRNSRERVAPLLAMLRLR